MTIRLGSVPAIVIAIFIGLWSSAPYSTAMGALLSTGAKRVSTNSISEFFEEVNEIDFSAFFKLKDAQIEEAIHTFRTTGLTGPLTECIELGRELSLEADVLISIANHLITPPPGQTQTAPYELKIAQLYLTHAAEISTEYDTIKLASALLESFWDKTGSSRPYEEGLHFLTKTKPD